MTKYAATDTVATYKTVEEAVAALETALEATDNDKVVRTCTVIKIEANRYASVLVVTDAVG